MDSLKSGYPQSVHVQRTNHMSPIYFIVDLVHSEPTRTRACHQNLMSLIDRDAKMTSDSGQYGNHN